MLQAKSSFVAILLSAAILLCQRVNAVDVTPLAIGKPAPDFNLPGVDGKNHRLADFASAKVLVVIFTCNHCPTAQAYESRIIKLNDDFQGHGVALIAINPNDPQAISLAELGYTEYSDTFDEMKLRAKERGYQFPYLYDGKTQAVAKAFGVLATPQVFIFDSNRQLQYEGAIDDSDIHEVHHNYAHDAIEDLLANKPVAVPKSHVFGCSTKWADKGANVRAAVAKWDQEPVSLETIDATGAKQLAANDSQNLRLINVWATWCGPCEAEIPEFVEMQRMYRHRGFEVVTISMDEPNDKARALKFLQEHHVSGTNFLYTSTDRDALISSLDAKWEGPLPHTMLVAPSGQVIYRHTGSIDPIEVKKYIVAYLGRTYGPLPGMKGVEALQESEKAPQK